ncbi:MAG: hypothetical protein A2X86_00565 [Bdellovibrionales bacterium GWA2_49_15]|nr:MAG: hypothetical protein A2X86_00565 [Bdellovibrionales bacterium GWA2_49_15]HAZ13242.1 hypothetical protein [Bdellovibrionales bacterium]
MQTKRQRRFDKRAITSDQLAIRELRLELGMTLKEAGIKLGLSDKGIGAIENGRISLDRKRIEDIVLSYGLSYLDFIRAKKIIERNGPKKSERKYIRRVFSNSDRRSYQKIITKECQVLRSMRRIKKIPQHKGSALCGYPRATIGHIENGRIELSSERIKHIVECYGFKIDDFKANIGKVQLRDIVIDNCLEKIEHLDDTKLEIVKNLLGSL